MVWLATKKDEAVCQGRTAKTRAKPQGAGVRNRDCRAVCLSI
jgi:hypothetical protein